MKNFSFMAFGKAQESKEAPEIKRYTGVGSVFVMGVNPNRLQWNEEKKVYNLIPLSEEESIVEGKLENTEVSGTPDENNEL